MNSTHQQAPDTALPSAFKDPDDEQLRFECDLEFVQFLSNPHYILCTA